MRITEADKEIAKQIAAIIKYRGATVADYEDLGVLVKMMLTDDLLDWQRTTFSRLVRTHMADIDARLAVSASLRGIGIEEK